MNVYRQHSVSWNFNWKMYLGFVKRPKYLSTYLKVFFFSIQVLFAVCKFCVRSIKLQAKSHAKGTEPTQKYILPL